jgi:hypothetical protein
MSANREYKDSVFSWLFGTPDVLRELYGALAGVTFSPDIPVVINAILIRGITVRFLGAAKRWRGTAPS